MDFLKEVQKHVNLSEHKKVAILLYETLSLGRANPTNDIAFIYSKSFFKKPVLK